MLNISISAKIQILEVSSLSSRCKVNYNNLVCKAYNSSLVQSVHDIVPFELKLSENG